MNATESQDKLSAIAQSGVDIVQMELPDLNGALRGKFYSTDKVKSTSKGGISSVIYQFTPADDVWSSDDSSYENGFPDIIGIPDPETAIVLPWRTNQASVIFDVQCKDGKPFPICPRSVLKSLEKRFAMTGYEPKFGVEFECFVLKADDELIAQGKHHQMAPLGRLPNAYRLNQAEEARELGVEFIRRMKGIGIAVEVFHTELGNGAVEFALSPQGAVRAADNATRAKVYFKELCQERGLAATFMAKWDPAQAGCGGHIHQSVWQDGRNAFVDQESGDLSEVARRYIAGMLATMADSIALFRPVVNSYRRIDVKAWAPEDASWGYDDRCKALRVITFPSDSAWRVEHRIPGADANTYLSVAAMLAGGLYGIENELEPVPAGNATTGINPTPVCLPNTLALATELFRNSAFCREYLGTEFVSHFSKSRDVEWQYWCDWQKANISRFELDRYFDTI